MADQDLLRERSKAILCRLCRQAIQTAQQLVLVDSEAAHAVCLERSASYLSENERSRLVCLCSNHEVARCATCSRTYRISEMDTDVSRRHPHFCPLCRVNLVWSVRQHIANCSTIRQNDPQWQVAVREMLERTRELRKVSGRLSDASQVTRTAGQGQRTGARRTA
jgi:hypothetical protein